MVDTLRIAIVLEDTQHPPAWCMRLIEQIKDDLCLQLVALISSPDVSCDRAINPLVRVWKHLEEKLAAKPQPVDPDAFALAVAHLPVIPAENVVAIEACVPDVILDLSAGQGRGVAAGSARHGVWFADFLQRQADLSLRASDAPVTRITLFQRSANRADPVAVATATLNPKFIAARNALFRCEKAVSLIMRALRRTQAHGTPDRLDGVELPPATNPGAGDFSRYLGVLARITARRTLNHYRAKVGKRPGMFFLKSTECSWPEFDPATATAHISNANSYYADPFLWEWQGELYCFFEEYDYRTARGHISVGRFMDGELTGIEPVLKTGYHLSFPFLFEHDGELYMLPETSEMRRLEVWKCREFPNQWELHATTLEGVAASDSTLNLIDGTWWLFTNISCDPFLDMNSELQVFRVDGPNFGRIEPHALNPVVFDSLRARNAGRILEMDGKLYRPAQENSHGFYGYGLRLMEIRHLSLEDYEEVEVRTIAPDFEPGIIGCHHLDMRGGRVIMDVRKRIGGYAG